MNLNRDEFTFYWKCGGQNVCSVWLSSPPCKLLVLKLFSIPFYSFDTHLTVEAQQQKHDEEKNGPKRRQWHHRHSFRVSNEGQARTYWEENRGRWGSGESTISKASNLHTLIYAFAVRFVVGTDQKETWKKKGASIYRTKRSSQAKLLPVVRCKSNDCFIASSGKISILMLTSAASISRKGLISGVIFPLYNTTGYIFNTT